MNLDTANIFLSGAIMMGFLASSYLFLGFWRRSRIALFGFFSVAFALFAAERLVLAFVDSQDELRPLVYTIRLAGFLVIIAAIIAQNRRAR